MFLGKQFKNLVQAFCLQSDAGVLDCNLGLTLVLSHRKPYRTPARGEFDSVVQQIVHALRQAHRVAVDHRRCLRKRLLFQAQSSAGKYWPEGICSGSGERNQVKRLRAKLNRSTRDSRNIQQIVHQPSHVTHLSFNDVARPPHPVVIGGRSSDQFVRGSDGSQGIPKFMRQGGQKFVFLFVGTFERGEGFGALSFVDQSLAAVLLRQRTGFQGGDQHIEFSDSRCLQSIGMAISRCIAHGPKRLTQTSGGAPSKKRTGKYRAQNHGNPTGS